MLSLFHHAASLYHSVSHVRHTYSEAHDEMTSSVFEAATETVEHLRLKLPEHLASPRVGIVCGSGLGGLAETVNQDGEKLVWDYKDVPNFPISTGEWYYVWSLANYSWIFEHPNASQIAMNQMTDRASYCTSTRPRGQINLQHNGSSTSSRSPSSRQSAVSPLR